MFHEFWLKNEKKLEPEIPIIFEKISKYNVKAIWVISKQFILTSEFILKLSKLQVLQRFLVLSHSSFRKGYDAL